MTFYAACRQAGLPIVCQQDMSLWTTYQVGGPADYACEPTDRQMLLQILRIAKQHEMPTYLIGKGSNIIVADAGVRGLVIRLGEKLDNYQVMDAVACQQYVSQSGWLFDETTSYVCVGAGADLGAVVQRQVAEGLGDVCFACGIPGSVGGAVYMNAGAYDGTMADVVFATAYLDEQLNVKWLSKAHHDFGYRHSFFRTQKALILQTIFALKPNDKRVLKAKVDDFTQKRQRSQPLDLPSAGSVFKRPPGHYTGPLITECGLKGYRVGGAAVSQKHAGFIVNVGGATAANILTLIETIQTQVYERFQVDLTLEQRLLGDFDTDLVQRLGAEPIRPWFSSKKHGEV